MQHKVIKYHVEAKDNAKYLGSIEKTSHSIYLQVHFCHSIKELKLSTPTGSTPDGWVIDQTTSDHQDDLPGEMFIFDH